MQAFFSYMCTVAIVILFSCKVNDICATDCMHHVCGGTAFTCVVHVDNTYVCVEFTHVELHATRMCCEVVNTVHYWYLPCI